MFASLVKETVAVGDNTVIIRKLSALSLEKAIEQKQISVALISQRLGSEMIKAFQDRAKKAEETAAPATPAVPAAFEKHSMYDRSTVLVAGIHSWSGPDCREDPSVKTIGDLDEETAELLFHKILSLSLVTPVEVSKD